MFPPQRGRNGEREAHKHTRKRTLNGNFVHQRIRQKKEAQMQRLLCHLFESASREQMARDLFCKTTTKQKNHIIMGLTLPDIFAILMRYSVRVNKTPLFCLLVSQTTSLTSDPCCDPARRQRTIPQGYTAVELSDVLI